MKRNSKGQFEKGSKLQDLTGQKFGRWNVLEKTDRKSVSVSYWKCVCECGTVREVLANQLKSGRSKSCGCYSREEKSARFTEMNKKTKVTHGYYGTRLYSIWSSMKARCETKTNGSYKNYGAKGIKVCEPWRDFSIFKDWALSNGYEDSLTIERMDIKGNYEPSNCKWVTMKEQQNNRSNTTFVMYNNESKPISAWCDELGLDYELISGRYRNGIKPPRLFYDGDLRKYKKTTPR